MQTADFDYDLPPEYIAQTPVEPRDAARLLVLDRKTGGIQHTYFNRLGNFLAPGDLLVINETRVIAARLYARKQPGGGKVELLLLRRLDEIRWEALVGGKGLRPGVRLTLNGGPAAEIVTVLEGPKRVVRFAEPIEPFLESIGNVPLPPYIHTALRDPERYQTVFARQPGSAAAPTAGLHFTPRLIEQLQSAGIEFAHITLHVGLDTFLPVNELTPQEHKIHTEWCELPAQTAAAVTRARRAGRRVIAVGTTSVRTLESAARYGFQENVLHEYAGFTDLFILPGYQFRIVDALITNFHLPRSTLIMLVSAFAGRERILDTYRLAMQEGYRFYSFGDAMLIL
ncbi:MAG: tRNA preQ1(34) S-adenosylmethionine ribosyltransferase-isomerase QueA [Anaerolineae bacterium UTCFX2]|jgi:S-adenosylmethionine:tRNA ribosyltransferase-isomerase|nr:tRNA preQ1(34) S-adenosylmethionine ribosyltransferase-isomerase QueA [Anaerolineae bacterium]MCZ7552858.1 tRNA preQ1(34) S-adenosylmethionine ribosyltransferase-isomerase QueA [Anaerolineales bacterium]OQY91419.1 MAG: tRNA preQ1(34) S-adenosylmethionine ribosyltransferase-isomerase QueA [Anaerolineae bacterium UTCFX2]